MPPPGAAITNFGASVWPGRASVAVQPTACGSRRRGGRPGKPSRAAKFALRLPYRWPAATNAFAVQFRCGLMRRRTSWRWIGPARWIALGCGKRAIGVRRRRICRGWAGFPVLAASGGSRREVLIRLARGGWWGSRLRSAAKQLVSQPEADGFARLTKPGGRMVSLRQASNASVMRLARIPPIASS